MCHLEKARVPEQWKKKIVLLIMCVSLITVKADKKAETERNERQSQLQQERNDEMRELALKMRKR